MIDVRITEELLSATSCTEGLTDGACGGLAVFIGAVRSETKGKKVLRLEYECYPSMALKEMKKIAEAAIQACGAKQMRIHHRTGILYPGDIAVVVVAGSPHREAAFEACRYAIDTLKKTVPIWKKEVFEDGEEWISAHA